MSNDIITGIDVGTYCIKAISVQRKGSNWAVLAYEEMPSFGLRKGAVVNVEEASKNIQILISRIEKSCNKKINSAFVNINGSHIYVIPSDGIISVSRADQRISEEDIERVLQASKAVNIGSKNNEILDVIPREFIIDDQRGIKKPENLTGVRLEAKVLLLCYFQPYFTNLTQSLISAKIQIKDVIPSPIAVANAVLTPQQKELGSAIIDIGGSTTSLAVYEEGELLHLAIFPIGSSNITYDIAIGLKTEVETAEIIKKQYGSCVLAKNEKDKKKIEIHGESSDVEFTKKELMSIIEPRVLEILDLVQKELKKINRHGQLPGGIVLTGGGAKIPKLKEITKNILKLPCQIGSPKIIQGLEDDPAIATVVGLALEGVDFGEKEGILNSTIKGWGCVIKKWLKNFIP